MIHLSLTLMDMPIVLAVTYFEIEYETPGLSFPASYFCAVKIIRVKACILHFVNIHLG
jgi:hypothetical protein